MKHLLAVFAAAALLPVFAPAVAHDDRNGTEASAVIRRYYKAIDIGDLRTAYSLWSDAGRASNKSYPVFRRGFAATAHTRVYIGTPTDVDAAAGSVYVNIPVEVRAVLRNGARQHFRGVYTLRRSNNVEGATPGQLQWHIASARLHVAG